MPYGPRDGGSGRIPDVACRGGVRGSACLSDPAAVLAVTQAGVARHVGARPGPTFHLISWHRQLVPIQGDATGIQLGWTTEGREVFPVLVEACERRHRAVTAIIFDALRVGPPSPEGSDSEDPGPTLSACHAANHIFGAGRELTYMGRH